MHSLRQEEQEASAWRAGVVLPPGLEVTAGIPPEVEDARRRFILSLRAMTARKEKQERDGAAIQAWMDALDREVAAYRRWRQRKVRRQIIAFSILAVILLGNSIPVFRGMTNLWWLMLFGVGGTAAAQAADSRRSKEMAGHLARARDPRAVSALAVAARDGDPDTKRLAEEGLRSILPQIQASDAEYVTDQGMNALLNLLGRTADPRLKIAIFRALEQVGDERAISLVNMLADTEADPRVREAAQECRRFLQSRAEQARLRQTLLRAATNAEPDRNLLRPAGATDTPAEQLLRPSSG